MLKYVVGAKPWSKENRDFDIQPSLTFTLVSSHRVFFTQTVIRILILLPVNQYFFCVI
jgi:hypothetical protein